MLADFFSIRLMMAMEKLWMGPLPGQLVEVAVDGFGMAAFGFELDRQVLNAELRCHPVADRLEEVGR